MRTTTLQFTQSARRVYTSVKCAVEKCKQLNHVVPNDDTFVIAARHEPVGMDCFQFVIGFLIGR